MSSKLLETPFVVHTQDDRAPKHVPDDAPYIIEIPSGFKQESIRNMEEQPSRSRANWTKLFLTAFTTLRQNWEPTIYNAEVKSGLFAMPTQTELAKASFLQLVRQIPGVFAETYGGKTLVEQYIRVIVPNIFSPVADEVYDIEGRTRQHYQNARLDIEIEDARCYIEQSENIGTSPHE